MPTIPFNVPNRAINAICTRHGYQPLINGTPNPQSKEAFFKDYFSKRMMAEAKEHETNTAAAAASKTAATDAETNIIIT